MEQSAKEQQLSKMEKVPEPKTKMHSQKLPPEQPTNFLPGIVGAKLECECYFECMCSWEPIRNIGELGRRGE